MGSRGRHARVATTLSFLAVMPTTHEAVIVRDARADGLLLLRSTDQLVVTGRLLICGGVEMARPQRFSFPRCKRRILLRELRIPEAFKIFGGNRGS